MRRRRRTQPIGPYHRFSPERETWAISTQCLQKGNKNDLHCKTQPMKAKPRIFTLLLEILYSNSTTKKKFPALLLQIKTGSTKKGNLYQTPTLLHKGPCEEFQQSDRILLHRTSRTPHPNQPFSATNHLGRRNWVVFGPSWRSSLSATRQDEPAPPG